MKERPILFTGPSIPMVMDGTKTQTRRIADLERLSVELPGEIRSDLWDIMPKSQRMVAKKGRHRASLNPQGAVSAILDVGVVFGLKPGEFHFRCPLVDGTTHLADHGNGKKVWTVTPVGEQRLWVKETWGLCDQGKIIYRADDIESLAKERQWVSWPTWKSPYHMFRIASRTNLIPIQARLMRLQDITDEDSRAEGVTFTDYGKDKYKEQRSGWHYGPSKSHEDCLGAPRYAFANAWNSIHAGPDWNLKPGLAPWDLNVWVWAYTFRKEA